MTQFPPKIPLPDSVIQARDERQKHMLSSMKWGISIRSIIIISEFFGAAYFGTSALFMDALSSFVDVFCSLLLAFFIKIAARPPDQNHPFGHGKYEPLAGLQLGLLLFLIGLIMTFQQLWHLQAPSEGALDKRIWLIPFAAVMLLEGCYFITMKAAKEHDSPALAVDAYHYRIDSLTSVFALIALVFAAFFPAWSFTIDRLGAISIGLFMIALGLYSVKNNMHQLLDTAPDKKYFELVCAAAKNVSGVKDTEKTRILVYGPDAHVNIDVEVDPKMTVEDAHRISQQVRASIQKEWPSVRDVVVHIEPFYPHDH